MSEKVIIQTLKNTHTRLEELIENYHKMTPKQIQSTMADMRAFLGLALEDQLALNKKRMGGAAHGRP